MSKNVFVLDHPLTGTYLNILRDKASSSDSVRNQVSKLSHMLALEATKDIKTEEISCQTPICTTKEKNLSEKIGIVPILRAGIGMVDPFLHFLPQAEVLFLGMYRNEETHEPVSYYNKLGDSDLVNTAYIIDPMLATGGSALLTIETIKNWGVENIKFCGIIGAPEGIKTIHDKYPEVDIHLASLDKKLNENAYIVPGLGDAGDRIFNT